MMMDYGMGWGIGWLWMLLFWLIPILLVLAAAKYLFSGKPQSGGESREDNDKALETLEDKVRSWGDQSRRVLAKIR